MGLLKKLMIFGKTGLQGLPTRVTLFLWAFSRQGPKTRGYWGPPIHNMGFCSRLGESPNTWKHFGPELTSVLVAQLVGRLGGDGFWEGDYGWGVRVRRHFGARGMSSVRYGTRLGDLKENWFLLFSNLNTQHTPSQHIGNTV